MSERAPFGNCLPNPELDALLEKARNHVMTPAERREQRVSFIYGMQSADSKVTKEEIAARLNEQDGHDTLTAERDALREALSALVGHLFDQHIINRLDDALEASPALDPVKLVGLLRARDAARAALSAVPAAPTQHAALAEKLLAIAAQKSVQTQFGWAHPDCETLEQAARLLTGTQQQRPKYDDAVLSAVPAKEDDGWRTDFENAPPGVDVQLWQPKTPSGKSELAARQIIGFAKEHRLRPATHWRPLPAPPVISEKE